MQLGLVVDRVKHSLLTVGCGLLFLYFVLPGVVGDRGLLAMGRLENQLSASKAELADLKQQRVALEARTKLLRPDNLDLDMLDERARATLGVTKPTEYVIYYDQEK